MVGAAGLEPATLCLEGRCSIQLSYAPTRAGHSGRIIVTAMRERFPRPVANAGSTETNSYIGTQPLRSLCGAGQAHANEG
jgi:hypothetical protein